MPARIVLEDWQVFVEFNLLGWVHVEHHLRRFRRSYERSHAANAGNAQRVAACTAFADGEPKAHVYSAVTTAEQARVFDVARGSDSECGCGFRQRLAWVVGKHDITAGID